MINPKEKIIIREERENYENSLLDEYEKLARFINANETDVFLTGEQLKNILDDID